MTDPIDFTREEKYVVNYYLSGQYRKQWWFWSCVFIPSAVFALYGLLAFDPIAIFVGWGTAMFFVCWYFSSMKRSAVRMAAILEKYENIHAPPSVVATEAHGADHA